MSSRRTSPRPSASGGASARATSAPSSTPPTPRRSARRRARSWRYRAAGAAKSPTTTRHPKGVPAAHLLPLDLRDDLRALLAHRRRRRGRHRRRRRAHHPSRVDRRPPRHRDRRRVVGTVCGAQGAQGGRLGLWRNRRQRRRLRAAHPALRVDRARRDGREDAHGRAARGGRVSKPYQLTYVSESHHRHPRIHPRHRSSAARIIARPGRPDCILGLQRVMVQVLRPCIGSIRIVLKR